MESELKDLHGTPILVWEVEKGVVEMNCQHNLDHRGDASGTTEKSDPGKTARLQIAIFPIPNQIA